MINKKSFFISLGFFIGSLVVVAFAIGIKKGEDDAANLLDVEIVEESTFENMNYYSLNKGSKVIALNANTLRIVNQKDLYFTAPDGTMFNSKGEEVAYEAIEGDFKNDNRELSLTGDVKLRTEEGSYKADRLYYNGSKSFLEARGNIAANMVDQSTRDKMKITSRYMSSWLDEERSLFVGDVKGIVSRNRVYEGSFNFRAERMELNRLKSLINLSDNVYLERNNYNLRAQNANIFLENFNKKLKYYVLYDDIKLVEELTLSNGAKQTRKAYSEKLEGYMSQGKIVLTGAPSVEQGDDLIKGYQITLRENVELVEVEEAQSSFKLRSN